MAWVTRSTRAVTPPGVRPAVGLRVTRRGLQIALGLLWLLDAALQFQPYMFAGHFANDVIAPTASGQPGWVAAGVHFSAGLINHAPVLFNAGFALVQLGLAVGLLWRRTARLTLAASVLWSLGVWYLGEGLGGIASGHASLLTGAPGAVLLYALVALSAWPSRPTTGSSADGGPGRGEAPRRCAPVAWAAVWVGGAALRALPGQNNAHDLAASVSGNAAGAPTWLAAADRAAASFIAGAGRPLLIALVVVELLVGLLALSPRTPARVAAGVGTVLALGFWLAGESLGQIYTGQATDPNSGPLLGLLALAVIGASARPRRRADAYPDEPSRPDAVRARQAA